MHKAYIQWYRAWRRCYMGRQVMLGRMHGWRSHWVDAWKRDKKLYLAVKIILKQLMPERDKEKKVGGDYVKKKPWKKKHLKQIYHLKYFYFYFYFWQLLIRTMIIKEKTSQGRSIRPRETQKMGLSERDGWRIFITRMAGYRLGGQLERELFIKVTSLMDHCRGKLSEWIWTSTSSASSIRVVTGCGLETLPGKEWYERWHIEDFETTPFNSARM